MDKKEYLIKIAIKAEKELKRKAYPRKHRVFINLLKINFEWETRNDCDGTYYYDEKNDISTIALNDRFIKNFKPNIRISRRAVDVMKHELLHHYVREWYDEGWSKKHHFNGDSSPIFLAYLRWFGVPSGHPSNYWFNGTEIYLRTSESETFSDFERMIMGYVREYRKEFEKYSIEENKEGTSFANTFYFGYGKEIGFKKDLCNYSDCTNKLRYEPNVIGNLFYVGSRVTPKDIEKLYNRKKWTLPINSEYLTEKVLEIVNERNIKDFTDKQKKILEFKVNRHKRELYRK